MDQEIIKRYFSIDAKKISENDKLLDLRSWTIVVVEFPIFIISMVHPVSHKKYCFKFLCDDFPISFSVVDPITFLPIHGSNWPQGGSFHTNTPNPFLCAPGLREYHTHDSHKAENQWNFTSPMFRLPSVLDIVYTHIIKSTS